MAILTCCLFLLGQALERAPRWHRIRGHQLRMRTFCSHWIELRCECGAAWLEGS